MNDQPRRSEMSPGGRPVPGRDEVAPSVAPASGMAGPAYAGPAPVRPDSRPKRSSEEIRRDLEQQRMELGESVELLRHKVNEITDWRGQVRKHRRQIVVGAAAVGFAVGAAAMLRRRR